MSNYYQYEFVSPSPLFAKVKEQLKSYFDTGAVDDLLFPLHTSYCLKRLSKASLPIRETVLYIDDYKTRLPDHMEGVREAWMCTDIAPQTIRTPGSLYTQTTSLLNPQPLSCGDTCDPCNPLTTQLIYKTNTEVTYTTRVSHLLKPGNIAVREFCSSDCKNFGSTSLDTFDIRGNQFITNFRQGDVYLIYYSKDYDESNYQLIPDNERIQDYIEAYLKYTVFEILWNQVTDETFHQIEIKYKVYTQLKDEAYINAKIEIMKQTTQQKIQGFIRDRNRFNKYRIS